MLAAVGAIFLLRIPVTLKDQEARVKLVGGTAASMPCCCAWLHWCYQLVSCGVPGVVRCSAFTLLQCCQHSRMP